MVLVMVTSEEPTVAIPKLRLLNTKLQGLMKGKFLFKENGVSATYCIERAIYNWQVTAVLNIGLFIST